MATQELTGNYKDTRTYKEADGATRARIERFKKENKLDSKHLYLLLLREDYRSLPKEEKQKGNRVGEILVLSGIATFLILTSQQRKDLLPFAGLYMIIVSIIYFSGIFNPVARQLNNINKLLKRFPETPSLKAYLLNQDAKEE